MLRKTWCFNYWHGILRVALSGSMQVQQYSLYLLKAPTRNLLPYRRHTAPMVDSKSADVSLFIQSKDRFDCVILDLAKECHSCEDDQFKNKMAESVKSWKADGVRALTVFVPSILAHRITILLEMGFDFHHANPGHVLMLKWLSETDDNNFPPYANHYIGVGGCVINEKGEVLVIQERFAFRVPKWKYPGGGADPGEDIGVTAKREVFEETGIESEFVGILCLRHQHGFRYGCSDLYFGCLMKATTTEIKKCDQEILQCQWMNVEDLKKQDMYPTNRYILDSYLSYLETGSLIKKESIHSFTYDSLHVVYRAGKVSLQGHSGEGHIGEGHSGEGHSGEGHSGEDNKKLSNL